MAADAFIQCRVSAVMKGRVQELAAREQITESALVKQLLEVVLRTSVVAGTPAREESEKPNRDARLYVRLDPEDRLMLVERASSRGMAPATYAAVLTRAHLRHLTPLPKEELLALKRAIAELGAIGRNLNQIARSLNAGGRQAGPGREELHAMLRVAEGLRDHVKTLLKANERSWEVGYAVSTH